VLAAHAGTLTQPGALTFLSSLLESALLIAELDDILDDDRL
jgi:hypothetical protein